MNQSNAKNEFTLEIDSLSYGPYGIGRHEGKAVMIPNTAPGDKVLARIVESKERYSVGELLGLMESSPMRQNPPCPYVGECGGCGLGFVFFFFFFFFFFFCVEDALR